MTKICIVDGYSTSRFMVDELRQRGADCVHVRSQTDPPAIYLRAFDTSAYVSDLGWFSEPENAARILKELGVDRVIAGTESGVSLADSLGHMLGLPSNRIELVDARRDKFVMAETLRVANLDAPECRLAATPDAGVDWFVSGSHRAVVVKPRASAGTDQVRVCQTTTEVADACRAVLDSRNLFGEPNHTVLLQEFLQGEEFYVNTVSLDGVHKVAEMWRSVKTMVPGGHPLYDFEQPVTVTDPIPAAITGYIRRVLTALGIENGAGHSEVMLTERGPVLIETGARLGGGVLPRVSTQYSGMSHVLLTTLSLTDQGAFESFEDSAVCWSRVVRYVSLINNRHGVAGPGAWQDRLRALDTFDGLATRVAPGAPLQRTHDLASAPGFVYLVSEHERDVVRDYAQIRRLEQEEIYLT